MQHLKLVPMKNEFERVTLPDAWFKAILQWQIVGLYAIAASFERFAAMLERLKDER